MPRFYFHIRNADEMTLDDEGTDLPDLNAARELAMASARELLANAIKEGRGRVPEGIVIADAFGRELATVPIRDVVPSHLRI
jgi:hypothetical protein